MNLLSANKRALADAPLVAEWLGAAPMETRRERSAQLHVLYEPSGASRIGLDELAALAGTTSGTVRVWRTTRTYRALVRGHQHAFARWLLAHGPYALLGRGADFVATVVQLSPASMKVVEEMVARATAKSEEPEGWTLVAAVMACARASRQRSGLAPIQPLRMLGYIAQVAGGQHAQAKATRAMRRVLRRGAR